MFLPSGTSGGSRVFSTLIPPFLLTKYGLIHCLSYVTLVLGPFMLLQTVRCFSVLALQYSLVLSATYTVLSFPRLRIPCLQALASFRDFVTMPPAFRSFPPSDPTTINIQPSSSTAYCIVDDCQRSRFLTCKNLSCPLLSLLSRIVLLSDVAFYR